MPPKIIQISRKDDIAEVIKRIKGLRNKEVVFEIEKGSGLFANSENLKLIKRTGNFLGKKITITTDDEVGRILARKVEMLEGEDASKPLKLSARVARSDIKPRFSDILGPRRSPILKAPVVSANILPSVPKMPKMSNLNFGQGSWSSNFSKVFILSLVALVIVVFALAVLLPKATVTVLARSESINRDFEITVDKNIPRANSDLLQIPGIAVSKEVSETKTFPATGTKFVGTKATGSVVIHNETESTLKLNAGTTTLVAGNKKYVFNNDVSGIKPGVSAAIGITALEAGDTYNLPVNTRFQIVNAALGKRNVYAVNPQAIGGGNAVASTVLSQEDIDLAASELMKDALAQVEAGLAAEHAAGVKLLDSGTVKESLAMTANKDLGEATDTFDMTLIAKITGVGFSEADLSSIVVSKIREVLSSDKYLVDNAGKQLTGQFKTVDVPNARGVLSAHFETVAAYQVDASNLSKILAGKSELEIKEILLSKPEIDEVKVEFWPSFLVHKAPRLNGKIYIKTQLAQ